MNDKTYYFLTFNGGDAKFDDIKSDLDVFVKEDNKYISIESSDICKYDVNFGHFWDGDGGYWFNPVKEIIYVKLVSKSNPNVNIVYTLMVDKHVAVAEVQLDKTNIDLDKVGATESLIVRVLPQNATNKDVTWTSSNKNVAAVDQDGVVTAVGKGGTTIVVETIDGNKKAECIVNVNTGIEENESKYGVNKISDNEVEFFLYQDVIKEGEQVLLLCSKNDDSEQGFQMTALEDNKFTYVINANDIIGGLTDGDRINYRFNVIIDGLGKLIENCPVYIHKIDNIPPTTQNEDVKAVEIESQKELVSQEILDKLVSAEAKISELEKENNNSGAIVNPDNNSNKLPQTGGGNVGTFMASSIVMLSAGAILIKKEKI